MSMTCLFLLLMNIHWLINLWSISQINFYSRLFGTAFRLEYIVVIYRGKYAGRNICIYSIFITCTVGPLVGCAATFCSPNCCNDKISLECASYMLRLLVVMDQPLVAHAISASALCTCQRAPSGVCGGAQVSRRFLSCGNRVQMGLWVL